VINGVVDTVVKSVVDSIWVLKDVEGSVVVEDGVVGDRVVVTIEAVVGNVEDVTLWQPSKKKAIINPPNKISAFFIVKPHIQIFNLIVNLILFFFFMFVK
jgi:hypothetical protein